MTGKALHNTSGELLPFVPDLAKTDSRVDQQVALGPLTVLGVAISAIGGMAFSALGHLFRTTIGLHATWLVNSAHTMWGSQRFPTGDPSTNSFWVAMLTFGEVWHNNHHAAPQSARHGLAWYEVDLNWYGIKALRTLGLAWESSSQCTSQPGQHELSSAPRLPKETGCYRRSQGTKQFPINVFMDGETASAAPAGSVLWPVSLL